MPMWWKRTWVRIAGGAAAVLIAAALTAWLSAPDPVADQPPGRDVELHTGAETTEAPRIAAVREVVSGLSVSLAAGSAGGLAEPLHGATGDLARLWPPNASTELDAETWWRTGDIASVMAVVTAGSTTTKVWLTLSYEAGQWLLLDVEGMAS